MNKVHTEPTADDDIDELFAPSPQASAQPLPLAGNPNAPHAVIFDIETGPLPDQELWKVVAPFDPASIQPYPAFDESSVKTGNLKDAAKIAEKIEAARSQHAIDAANHAAKNATAEADYIAGVKGRAALDAKTGRVLAIGYYDTNEGATDYAILNGEPGDEAAIVSGFWTYFEASDEHTRFIGHNIHGFDLPFLIQRSWLLGVEVPRGVIKGRYFSDKFVDTMAVWACGKMGSGAMAKLDDLAKAFGVGMKNGDGAMFAELLEKDRAAAMEYLKNDIAITHAVARRMGVCR